METLMPELQQILNWLPLIAGALHLLLSRWRDIGGTAVLCMAMMLLYIPQPFTVEQWGVVLGSAGMLTAGWTLGSKRGIWRPKVNAACLFISVLLFAFKGFIGALDWDVEHELLNVWLLLPAALAAAVAFVVALERPRPYLLPLQGYRKVSVTTGGRGKNASEE
jgi:hypothetical protein